MTNGSEVIFLMQASMLASDTIKHARADFATIFEGQPDVIGFTEVTINGLRNELTLSAGENGYKVFGGRGDTALAVRADHAVRDSGSILIHPGGEDEFGAYAARYLDWVTAVVNDEIVTVAEAHWVRPRTPERIRRHRMATDAAVALLKEKSGSSAIAFLLGDLNEDDGPTEDAGSAGARFEAAGITTIWDELGFYPATHDGGRTIDLIASVDADIRVTAVGVYVFRLSHSDHRPVAGFYTVERP